MGLRRSTAAPISWRTTGMNRRTQVVVAGGGIVGLAAANLLARIEALDVILVDAGDEAGFRIEDEVSLRVSAVSPGSVGLLTDIGAWPRIIAQRVCPYRDMKVWDAAGNVDGPETLSFEAAEFALPQLGFIVENVLLRWALQEQSLKQPLYACISIPGSRRSGRRAVATR